MLAGCKAGGGISKITSHKKKGEKEMENIMDSAVALYDGGWRASDLEQLISEYDFTPDQADEITAALAEIESEED